MQVTHERPDNWPWLTHVAGAAFVATAVAFLAAAARHPGARLAATGTPVRPAALFYWFGALQVAGLGVYVWSLYRRPVADVALYSRGWMVVALVGHAAGWGLWTHSHFAAAAGAFLVAAAAVTFGLAACYANTHTERGVPCPAGSFTVPTCAEYARTTNPVSMFGAWLWVLSYVAVVAAAFDAHAVSSPEAAANILALYIALTLVPFAQFFHDVHYPFVWWLALATVAAAVPGPALHAMVWASVGLAAGFSVYGMHARFLFVSSPYLLLDP